MVPVAHQVEVLILQHPLEVDNAKGTARLLHLCLPGSRLVVGEQWAPQVLQQWLAAPLPGAAHAPQPVLLYPATANAAALQLPPPPVWDAAALRAPAQLRLVVLDGTWRKSRKMLYLNLPLQQLARLPLHDLPASRYRIRKAHAPGAALDAGGDLRRAGATGGRCGSVCPAAGGVGWLCRPATAPPGGAARRLMGVLCAGLSCSGGE